MKQLKFLTMITVLLLGTHSFASAIDCYKKGTQNSLEYYVTMHLCRLANSTAPVDCYLDAQKDPALSQELSIAGMVLLCGGPTSGKDRISCYKDGRKESNKQLLDAYQTLYLCAGSWDLVW